MLTRRAFLAVTTAALASPAIGQSRARDSDLEAAIAPLDQLHSLQVRLGDDVIFSAAPRGPGLDRLANIKSCSKSLVSLVLGDAIARGYVPSVTATLGQVAPRLIPRGADAAVNEITLEDLVTLRAGLERTSGANYGGWVNSSNWVADALNRPMLDRPGGRMLYSTGSTHVLGAALAEASGESLLSLMRSALGRPMGIEIAPWTRDPQGRYLGGNEMALSPRAMLDIAVMVRDGGMFEGRQIIPATWIEESAVPRTRSQFSGLGYGYGWFLSRSGYMLARGYGGQVIAVNRDRGLAVSITSDPTRPARSRGYFGDIMALLEGPVFNTT